MDPITMMAMTVVPPAIIEPADVETMNMYENGGVRFDPSTKMKQPAYRYHFMRRGVNKNSTRTSGEYKRRRTSGRQINFDKPMIQNQREKVEARTNKSLEQLRMEFETKFTDIQQTQSEMVIPTHSKNEHPVTAYSERLEVFETPNYVTGRNSLVTRSPLTNSQYTRGYEGTLINRSVLADRNELVNVLQDESLVDAIRSNNLQNIDTTKYTPETIDEIEMLIQELEMMMEENSVTEDMMMEDMMDM